MEKEYRVFFMLILVLLGKIIVNKRDNTAFLSLEDLKASLRRVEHETSDLKFLNNQYVHKIKVLEKETKAKTEKIQQLQEKNLQAVVQTPGEYKYSQIF